MSKTYHWNAAAYARHAGPQFDWATELIGKLGLRGDEAVLDIGCGDGRVTELLARRVAGGRVLGIDRSHEMVSAGRCDYPAERYPKLFMAQMDAAALALSSAFDVAFSNATLHWLPDHLAVLRGVHRCLRPGGRLLFQMGGHGNAAGIIAVLEQVVARAEWRPYFTGFDFPYFFYRPDDYRAWAAQAGLKLVRAELVPKDLQQTGAEGLAGWIRSTWLPYIERLPLHLRDEFAGVVSEAYLTTSGPDPQGRVHVAMMRLEVEAVRP